MSRWVYVPRWVVCWVVFVWDITSMDRAFESVREVVDPSKGLFGGFVSTSSVPPALDHSFVISINLESVSG